MKRLLFLCLLVCAASLQAQVKGETNYLVKYEAVFAIDSTDIENKAVEMHSLYTGADMSYYASDLYIELDSLFARMQKEGPQAWRRMGGMQNMPRPEFAPQVYKDFQEGKAWIAVRLSRDQYIYEETEFPIQWEFGEETKQIEDYTVQKATASFGGRKWIAWFTMQVPIQDGPYLFSGLPGLILELEDSQGLFEFSVTSIEPLKETKIIDHSDKNYQTLTKARFAKAYENFRKNPLGEFGDRVRNMDFKLPDPTTGEMISGAEFARRIKEEAAKRNNYIERF